MNTKIYSDENVPTLSFETQQTIDHGVVNMGGPDEVYVKHMYANNGSSPNLLSVIDEDDNVLFRIDTEAQVIF